MVNFRKLLFTFVILHFFYLESKELKEQLNTPSEQVVEQELVDAEKEFSDAKKMFNPWYTGPLLAPSAHLISPGSYNIQPYFFIANNYGKYQQSGKKVHQSSLFQYNVQFPFQFGITDWIDGVVNLKAICNKEKGRSFTDIQDVSASVGFPILTEGPYIPAILFSVQEVFPTGKFQRLNPYKFGIDATGGGSFVTSFYLNFGKVVWWWSLLHPQSFRLSLEYSVPSHVSVHGFNAYGGGFGTDGKVKPGQSFSADFGYEFSFTQNWALAFDLVYTYSQKTTFSGKLGRGLDGKVASVGGPYSDQLSLAPALEYNVNENLGFIGGVWFTVWGRNASAFTTGVLSFEYTF